MSKSGTRAVLPSHRWQVPCNLLLSQYLPQLIFALQRKFPAMSRTVSVNRAFSRAIALAAFIFTAGLMGLAPPPQEEEDTKAKVNKKITVEDEGTSKKKVNADDDPLLTRKGPESGLNSNPDVKLDELEQ